MEARRHQAAVAGAGVCAGLEHYCGRRPYADRDSQRDHYRHGSVRVGRGRRRNSRRSRERRRLQHRKQDIHPRHSLHRRRWHRRDTGQQRQPHGRRYFHHHGNGGIRVDGGCVRCGGSLGIGRTWPGEQRNQQRRRGVHQERRRQQQPDNRCRRDHAFRWRYRDRGHRTCHGDGYGGGRQCSAGWRHRRPELQRGGRGREERHPHQDQRVCGRQRSGQRTAHHPAGHGYRHHYGTGLVPFRGPQWWPGRGGRFGRFVHGQQPDRLHARGGSDAGRGAGLCDQFAHRRRRFADPDRDLERDRDGECCRGLRGDRRWRGCGCRRRRRCGREEQG